MPNSLVETYFKSKDPATIAPGFLAYLANLECVSRVAPEVARSIVQELADQRRNIKMIASENFSSLATQCAMANLLTDKYAEGIPHHRFYAGLRQCRLDRGPGQSAGARALRRGARLCPAAQRRRRQSRRLLGHPAGQGRAPRDGQGPRRGERRGARPRRLVQALARAVARRPPGTGQPAPAGHGPRLRRPPHPRLPAQRLRKDVRGARLHGRSRPRSCSTTTRSSARPSRSSR